MHIQDKHNAIALAFFLVFLSACKGNQKPAAPATLPSVAVALPSPTPETPKEKPVYVYAGDKYRDPFTPAGQSNNYQPDAVFDPQRASVKAIIFGNQCKGAILSSGGSGSYFVKDGKIFDVMGKTIEGFTAKIFVDRVVVLGEADTTFELKIRTEGEEEKS